MTYADGAMVQIGDQVSLGGKQRGIIVGIIHEDRYADGYNKDDWHYLASGILVNTDFGDLRLDSPDEDLELIVRAEPRYRLA